MQEKGQPLKRDNITALEQKLGHTFRRKELLEQALTHASFVPDTTPPTQAEGGASVETNERLEFLGDAVLDLIVSDAMISRFPELSEGALTLARADVVSGVSLSAAARQLELDRYLRVGKGITEQGQTPASLFANALEAIIGAIYLDGGLDAARRSVLTFMGEQITKAAAEGGEGSWKSRLQQHTQSAFGSLPVYEVSAEEGPDHRKRFTVDVIVEGRRTGSGKGPSKKEAQEQAAREALLRLDSETET